MGSFLASFCNEHGIYQIVFDAKFKIKILKYLDIKKLRYYNIKYRKEVDSIMKIERIQQERIWLKNGQLGLLSTACLPDGRYETMLLDQNGEEI